MCEIVPADINRSRWKIPEMCREGRGFHDEFLSGQARAVECQLKVNKMIAMLETRKKLGEIGGHIEKEVSPPA